MGCINLHLDFSSSADRDLLFIQVCDFTQYLIPMFSVWWILFVLREYVEGEGNELLYVNRYKLKFFDILALFVFYLLCVGVLYLLFSIFVPHMYLEYIRIFCVCVFYFGFVYFFYFYNKELHSSAAGISDLYTSLYIV